MTEEFEVEGPAEIPVCRNYFLPFGCRAFGGSICSGVRDRPIYSGNGDWINCLSCVHYGSIILTCDRNTGEISDAEFRQIYLNGKKD